MTNDEAPGRPPKQPLVRGFDFRPRKRTQHVDLMLLVVVVVLSLFGLLTILSASAPTAQFQLHDALFFVKRQFYSFMLGIAVLLFGAIVNLDLLRRWSKWLLLVCGFMLFATHLPGLGVEALGAHRWLRIGPLSVQPSELAKIAIIIFVADMLARHGGWGWGPREFRQILLPVGGFLGLVLFEPDLGSTICMAVAVYGLFFVAGTRIWAMAMVAVVGSAAVMYHSLHTPYQRLRWLAFMNPWEDAQGIGFQLVQSLMAIGSGGVMGTGWGQGKQKLFYLPIQHTDFIFAVLAEELGLVGSLTVILMFVILAWRGFAIASRSREPYHQLLAIGLTSLVVGQALINIGVVTAALPTTGIPLPFLSVGGTSLLITLFAMGLVLNVSRQPRAQLRVVNGSLQASSSSTGPLHGNEVEAPWAGPVGR